MDGGGQDRRQQFSSSLLQVHLARTILKPGQKVGIITARKAALGREHLMAIGIEDIPMAIPSRG